MSTENPSEAPSLPPDCELMGSIQEVLSKNEYSPNKLARMTAQLFTLVCELTCSHTEEIATLKEELRTEKSNSRAQGETLEATRESALTFMEIAENRHRELAVKDTQLNTALSDLAGLRVKSNLAARALVISGILLETIHAEISTMGKLTKTTAQALKIAVEDDKKS